MENNKIRENTKRVGASTHPTLAHFTTSAIEHFQADGHHLFAIRVNRLLAIMDKFKPTEHTDWNVDMQKQHYLQNNHIEQYWQAIEQY